jgi:hypothetical protein
VYPRRLLVLVSLLVASLDAHGVSAETPQKTPVSVTIAGHGSIRLVVADGATRPCESSDNHVLFDGHAAAGDVVKVPR